MSASAILSGLASQQSEGVLCDVTLVAEGRQIHAHRAVLAAGSTYFNTMFTSEFKEKNEKVITLHDVDYDGLCIVIDCIYKSKLKLTKETVANVFAIANLLQISEIVNECQKYMIKAMDTKNCLPFRALGEKYGLEKVVDKAHTFFLKNFLDISKTVEFKDLSKDALIQYLSDDCLNFQGNELEVFKAAQTWLEAAPERRQYILEVMKNVRFMLISTPALDELLDLSIIENNKDCQRLIRDAFQYHFNVYGQPIINSPQNRPRGKQDILTICGGFHASGVNYENQNRWKNLWNETCIEMHTVTSTKDDCRHTYFTPAFVYRSVTAVQMNNFLFVFGLGNETFTPISMRYDASISKWIDLKCMPSQGAVDVASAICGTDIYIFGGMFVNKDTLYDLDCPYRIGGNPITNAAYMYHILTNTWEKLPDMPQACTLASACSTNGLVYLSGGLILSGDPNSASHKLFAFDPKAKLWLSKRRMLKARVGHRMEAIGDQLYAMGGNTESLYNQGNPFQINDVEMFNIHTEQWVLLNSTIPCFYRGVTLVDDKKIYLVGGIRDRRLRLGRDEDESRDIDVFNTADKSVRSYRRRLFSEQSYHACGFMTVPELL